MEILVVLGSLFVCFALGVPIAYALGLAALSGAWWSDIPFEYGKGHSAVVDTPIGCCLLRWSLCLLRFFLFSSLLVFTHSGQYATARCECREISCRKISE